MNKNIFEGARFGDKFLTRDGSEGLFIQYIKQNSTNPCMKDYYLCTIKDKKDGTTEDWTYNSDGTGYSNKDCPEYDIVSRYQEPSLLCKVDEDKLDELANSETYNYISEKCKLNNNMFNELLDSREHGFYDGFKAGYRKAKEE